MFTHLVMLKKEPWFLYCIDEKNALEVSDKFPGEVSGIVIAESLIVKQPRFKRTLEQEQTFQISHNPDVNIEQPVVENNVSLQEEVDRIDLAKEMTDELTKELES